MEKILYCKKYHRQSKTISDKLGKMYAAHATEAIFIQRWTVPSTAQHRKQKRTETTKERLTGNNTRDQQS